MRGRWGSLRSRQQIENLPHLPGAGQKRAPKKLVAVRLDADVFEWIRQFGAGYSTRINSVLRAVMTQQR
jgi:uncharacterized protein (DUF4415 family)